MQVKQFLVIAMALAMLPPGSIHAISSLQKVTDRAEQGLYYLSIVGDYGMFAAASAGACVSLTFIQNVVAGYPPVNDVEDPFGSIPFMLNFVYAASATALTLTAWTIALRNRTQHTWGQSSSYMPAGEELV